MSGELLWKGHKKKRAQTRLKGKEMLDFALSRKRATRNMPTGKRNFNVAVRIWDAKLDTVNIENSYFIK